MMNFFPKNNVAVRDVGRRLILRHPSHESASCNANQRRTQINQSVSSSISTNCGRQLSQFRQLARRTREQQPVKHNGLLSREETGRWGADGRTRRRSSRVTATETSHLREPGGNGCSSAFRSTASERVPNVRLATYVGMQRTGRESSCHFPVCLIVSLDLLVVESQICIRKVPWTGIVLLQLQYLLYKRKRQRSVVKHLGQLQPVG